MRLPAVPLAALLLGACAHQPPPPTVVSMPVEAAPDTMARAVEAVLHARRYSVLEWTTGRVRAQVLGLGHRAYAVVDILYYPQNVEIRWVDGNVNPYSERYQRWMRGMSAAIQRRAWRLAHRGGSALPPMPPGYGVVPEGEPAEGEPPADDLPGAPDGPPAPYAPPPGYDPAAPGAPPPPA